MCYFGSGRKLIHKQQLGKLIETSSPGLPFVCRVGRYIKMRVVAGSLEGSHVILRIGNALSAVFQFPAAEADKNQTVFGFETLYVIGFFHGNGATAENTE